MPKGKIIGIVLAVLVLIGLGFFFATKKGDKQSTKGNEEVSSDTAAKVSDACRYNDKDLCKFISAWAQLDSYTMTSTSTAGGVTTKSMFAIAGEDRTQLITYQNDKENFNWITIGKTTYMKDYADNKWTKQTYDAASDVTKSYDFDFDQKAATETDTTTYKKIGTETCDKLKCVKYEVITPGVADAQQFIWFDTKEFKVRKLQTITNGATTEMTFEYGTVTVEEPSPIKETTSSGASSTGLSAEDAQKALEAVKLLEQTPSATPASGGSDGIVD